MLAYKKELLIEKEENIFVQRWSETDDVPEHIHDFFEIVYIISGSSTHWIDGVKYEVTKGDLIFINKDQTHSFTVNGSTDRVNILLNPELISNELIGTDNIIFLFRHLTESELKNVVPPSTQKVSFRGADCEQADFLITMLLSEFESKNTGYRDVLKSLIQILFLKILRYLCNPNKACPTDREFLEDIMNYIDHNLDKKVSIAELAAKSFYTPAYFGTLLKKYCKKPFSAYLRERRMEKSALLLKTTNEHITDIMHRVGYSQTKEFYKHFKSTYGVPPSEYRKRK